MRLTLELTDGEYLALQNGLDLRTADLKAMTFQGELLWCRQLFLLETAELSRKLQEAFMQEVTA